MNFICEWMYICKGSGCIWKSWIKCIKWLSLNILKSAILISFNWDISLDLRIRSDIDLIFGLAEFNAFKFMRKVIWERVYV